MARGGFSRITGIRRTVAVRNRGVSVFELLLVVVLLSLTVATVAPAYLSSRRTARATQCSLRLKVMQDAKREVFDEMNRILPANHRLRITDRINPLHMDKIAGITRESPWRFHPEEPCPEGGVVSVGQTFLDPPSCSLGTPIATIGKPTQ